MSATNFRLRVQVEISRCQEEVTPAPQQEGSGTFVWVLTAEQAGPIDTCERALLETSAVALREAFADHLSRVSREYARSQAGSLEACQVKPYRVEGEIGRISFACYWAPAETGSGGVGAFPALPGKQHYRTMGFKELALVYGTCQESYRQAADLVNRVRHQPEATPWTTLRDFTEAEGQAIAAHREQQAEQILARHGFCSQGQPHPEAAFAAAGELVRLPPDQVAPVVADCAPQPEWHAEMARNPVAYEDPHASVQISLDEVGVKGQKESREDETPATDDTRKSVHNRLYRK